MAKECDIHFGTTDLKFYGLNEGSRYPTYNISIKDTAPSVSPVAEDRKKHSFSSIAEQVEEEEDEFEQAYACMRCVCVRGMIALSKCVLM